MKQNFVQFHSPGTFFPEATTKPIEEWDIGKAVKMAKSIKERYDAVPFCFQFLTRERADDELDSTIVKRSNRYFINCKVQTLEEVEARNDPDDRILLSNMRGNKYDRVATTKSGWRWITGLNETDVVLPS